MNAKSDHTTTARTAENPGRMDGQSGSAMLEFTFMIPLLVVLALGFVETGNLFRSWLTVQKAAQLATRVASTGAGYEEGTRNQVITDEAMEMLSTLPSTSKAVAIESWPGLDNSGPGRAGNAGEPCETVSVNIRYGYQPMTPIIGTVLPEFIYLEGTDIKINEPWQKCQEQ